MSPAAIPNLLKLKNKLEPFIVPLATPSIIYVVPVGVIGVGVGGVGGTAIFAPVVPSIVITDTALATDEKSIPKATDRVMTNSFCENGGNGVFI